MNKQLMDSYVVRIIENGSLTAAAKALKISQPALSQGLNGLEKELGFSIFNRRTMPITLTPEGELYYAYLKRQTLLEKDFQRRLEHYRSQMAGSVVIGAPMVYVNSLVVPSVSKLMTEHPDYSVKIRSGAMEELMEFCVDGKIDSFISTSNNLPDNFETQNIFREEICLCIPANHPLNKVIASEDGSLNWQMLNDVPFIFLEEEQPMQVEIDQILADKMTMPIRKLTVDQVSVAVELAARGVGCCFAAREAAADKALRIYPIPEMVRDIYIAYDRDVYRSEASTALINILRRH